MSPEHQAFHEGTLNWAQRYNEVECEGVSRLEYTEEQKIYLEFGFTSLFQYCLGALRLTESRTNALISVMRKAKITPALKQAIESGEMSVSRAKRIVSVIDNNNAELWIDKARTMKQRALEWEVAKETGRDGRKDFHFRAGKELEAKLTRVRELVSQSTKRPCSLEEAQEALTTFFIEKKDPTVKKLPSLRTVTRPLQRHIPRSIKNRVLIRDKGQCTVLDNTGQRCGSRQWVEVHHVAAFASGGDHSLSNLATLCYGHHRMEHGVSAAAVRK